MVSAWVNAIPMLVLIRYVTIMTSTCNNVARLSYTRDTFAEHFDGKPRDECSNTNQVVSLSDATQRIEARCLDCDALRPESPPGHVAPSHSRFKLPKFSRATSNRRIESRVDCHLSAVRRRGSAGVT